MNTIATKTQLPVQQIVQWCGIARGKFYDWRKRCGKVNEHNGLVPRDHWIEEWERQSVIDYFDCHPLDGYRRLTFMMLDEDVVAVSPSTTYRVLSKAGRLDRWNPKPSKKGTGFVQPLRAHQHWHTDILNLGGTFYYLCSFLDGASRAVVHWEIRESSDGSGCGVHLGASKGLGTPMRGLESSRTTVRSTSRRTSRHSSASQG